MIGSRLGNWVLDREIGRGGAGTVYLAHADPAPNEGPTRAALKVLAAELAADPGFLGRFQREIEVLGKLDHPGIVKLYGSGNQDARYYFAMEYVEGPSYEWLRKDRARLPWREVLELALQVAPALKHAHDRGIIHRDLKPANLLRGLDGQVKLTDFGIASLFASRHLTAAGSVVGTAEYLSPEQAGGRLVTPRSDLYSLGVVLYTLLTGRPPFEGEVLDLLQKHRFAQFDRPTRIVAEIPGDLEDLVCQLLAKEPAQRPADAGVLARQLAGLQRRLDYKGSGDTGDASPPTIAIPAPAAGPGPATIMSRLMRAELEDQNRGGPVQRFFNHPFVLVVSFALCVSILTYTFWPLGPEGLYQRGTALMASSEPGDWETGWDDYLLKLKQKYPNNTHQAELARFEQKVEEYRASKKAALLVRNARPMTEPQWFYQLGLRLRQRGDETGARRIWRALVEAFKDVPAEAPWVRAAEKELNAEGPSATVPRDLATLREAVRKAKELRAAGKIQEADEILRGLNELYMGDASAKEIINDR